MESIGEKLRLAREQANYTLDQVARDTNVARRFLQALEEEDFSAFPGETYALGFLRTYADYLGLDAQEMVARFHNLQIQEQPLPMNELLDTRRRIPPRLLYLGGGAAVVVLAIVGLILWQVLSGSPGGAREPLAAARHDRGVRVPGPGAHALVLAGRRHRDAGRRPQLPAHGERDRRHAHPVRAGRHHRDGHRQGTPRRPRRRRASRPAGGVERRGPHRRRAAGQPRALPGLPRRGRQPRPRARGPADRGAAAPTTAPTLPRPPRPARRPPAPPWQPSRRRCARARSRRSPRPGPRPPSPSPSRSASAPTASSASSSTRRSARSASSRRTRRSSSTRRAGSRSGCRTPARSGATVGGAEYELGRSGEVGNPHDRLAQGRRLGRLCAGDRPPLLARAASHERGAPHLLRREPRLRQEPGRRRGDDRRPRARGMDVRGGARGRRGAHREHLRLHRRGTTRVHRDRTLACARGSPKAACTSSAA